MAYASQDELLERLPEASASTDGDLLDSLLEQASAVVAKLTGETYDVAGEEASELVVYGTGTPFLRVGPHVGTVAAEDVEMPSGYTAPAFADTGEYLRATDSTGVFSDAISWPAGVPVTVTAQWGAAAAPGDVKAATLTLAAEWWRRRGAAFVEDYTGSIGTSGTLPSEVMDILKPRLAGHSLRTALS
jgi:hypothetical protein